MNMRLDSNGIIQSADYATYAAEQDRIYYELMRAENERLRQENERLQAENERLQIENERRQI
jgi:hypothetical protein